MAIRVRGSLRQIGGYIVKVNDGIVGKFNTIVDARKDHLETLAKKSHKGLKRPFEVWLIANGEGANNINPARIELFPAKTKSLQI